MKILLLSILISAVCAGAATLPAGCDVSANTEYGEVCGKKLSASNGDPYAAFKGMPYAEAPVKELRFAPPRPPKPYNGVLVATEHGPVCPQIDVIFGRTLQPRSMGEDCLRVNVYSPMSAMPDPGSDKAKKKPLVPVMVWIHGGSFSYGSGDSDIHGPEYLMSGKGIILVTFNYRLNVFGFLSLGTKEIPGNTGLRDIRFALEWVHRNIAGFGGDPAAVTIAGQSAGAVLTHITAISPSLNDNKLVDKVMCFSGMATVGFYSPSPAYTKFINPMFMLAAGINPIQTPQNIYKTLIEAPIDKLMAANKEIIDFTSLISFAPVIEEKSHPGVVTIIPKDPEILLDEGYGKEYVTWLEFTNDEAQVSKQRFEEVNLETKFQLAPILTLPMNVLWSSKVLALPVITAMHLKEYFDYTQVTLDKFLDAANDQFYIYPTLRLAEKRLKNGAKPTYIAQFAFYDKNNPFKVIQNRDWPGASHTEDITYFFRVNSILSPLESDELAQDNEVSRMKKWVTDLVAQFVKTGSPVPESESPKWPPTDSKFSFLNMSAPFQYDYGPATPYMMQKKKYFDKMNSIARGM